MTNNKKRKEYELLDDELKKEIEGLNDDEVFRLAVDYHIEFENHSYNIEKAIALYKLVSDYISSANNNLGCIYSEGEGAKKNNKLAMYYFKKAIGQGCSYAINNIANEFRGDNKNNLSKWWYEKSVFSGSIDGLYELARNYCGETDENIDYELAFNLVNMAMGHPFKYDFTSSNIESDRTCYYSLLAKMYLKGLYVKKDIQKGIDTLKTGVQEGYGACANSLGILYEEGKIREEFIDGITSYINKKKAFNYYKKAMYMGDKYAVANLADCYFKGIGTVQDERKAKTYLKRAKRIGVAQEYIDELEQEWETIKSAK